MKKEDTVQVAFRFSTSLLKRLDAFVAKQTKLTGLSWTRADAVRHLLNMSLGKGKK